MNCDTRLWLVQTDTTVGFLSHSSAVLDRAKKRHNDKPYLKVYASFQRLREDNKRVPEHFRSQLRRSKKTSFIVKNQAFRVVTTGNHHLFLHTFGNFYSSSANLSTHSFEREYCTRIADIIVEDSEGLYESIPSSLFKLGRYKKVRLR